MRSFIISTIIALSVALVYAGTNKFTNNKYVTVEVDVNGKDFKPGSSADMLISLKPVSGIHINLRPAVEVKLDSASAISLAGNLHIPKGKEYLDTGSPIIQRITIPKNARPGEITVKGTLTYYYCSDKEGWCSKFKQPIDVTLSVNR